MWDHTEKGKWWDQGVTLVSGCTRVSEACENCWALAMEHRYGRPTEVQFHPERLKRFCRRKPAVFAIWNDLFHGRVSYEEIKSVFDAASSCPQHRLLILTKRPDRALIFHHWLAGSDDISITEWPRNCWLGTTVENQQRADERILKLLEIPAAKRFLSVEPMLEPVDLQGVWWPEGLDVPCPHDVLQGKCYHVDDDDQWTQCRRLDWVIVGAESGPKKRPCALVWVRNLVQQCQRCNVPVFVKQLNINGAIVKDQNDPRWPDWAVRQIPEVTHDND